MSQTASPAEIASKTLKTLVARRLPPTPENYTRIYAEVSGQSLESLLEGGRGNHSGNTEEAQRPVPAWSSLIRDLLRQLETNHKGITLSRKKDGLDTVLAKFGSHPDQLYDKLQALLRSWSGATVVGAAAVSGSAGAGSAESAAGGSAPAVQGAEVPMDSPGLHGSGASVSQALVANKASEPEMMQHLRELLAQTLESNKSLQPDMEREIQALVQQVRTLGNHEQVTDLARKLRHFWVKLELRGGDKARIHEGLISLLRLLVENVGELVADDKWLHGQIAVLQEIIAQPLDKRRIFDAERSLREALIKQSTLKRSLADAKETLKTLMTTFIDRMGELTESTGEYHAKIENYSQKIGRADNITELGHILQDIMQDTRVLQASALRSHEELVTARRQADQAEQKIRKLEQELESVSELVREDQLTGTLNRRGMEEMLERETTRSDRMQAPLCVALLDIDNFKLFNDLLGHQAGDQALMHLSEVVKASVRPSDLVARYGGEEFLIILPDTDLDEAADTISRLQQALARKLFIYDKEEILITFSAGVAQRQPGEITAAVIGRADQAMYAAKTAGKNRVAKAE